MATKNSGASKRVEQTIVTGRTPSDAVVEITRLAVTVFGIGTPFIIVVVAAAYGFLQLQQVYRETDERRAAAMTSMLAETRASYKSIAELSNKQIETIDDTLDIQDRLGKGLKTLEAEQEKRTKKLLILQEKLEEMRVKAAAEEVEFKERQRNTEANLLATEEKLKKSAADIQRRTDDLVKRVGSITELREVLQDLAEAVKKELSEPSQSYQLAVNAIAEYVIDPVEILTRYAKNPDNKTATASLESLAGLSTSKLRELVEKFNGLDYSFWSRFEFPEDEDSGFFCVAKVTSTGYKGLVVLGEGQGTIVGITIIDEIFATKLFDHNDWSRAIAVIVSVEGGELDVEDRPIAMESSTWRIATLAPSDVIVESLYQTEPGAKFLDTETFKRTMRNYNEGRDYLSDVYEPPGLNLAMQERAQRFELQVLAQADLDLLPELLKRSFTAFLTSAVNGESEAGAIILAPHLGTAVLGQVAAAALRPGFRISSMELLVESGIVQQQVSPATEEQPTGYLVRALYRKDAESFGGVIFELTKREGARGWLLTSFEFDTPRESSLKSRS